MRKDVLRRRVAIRRTVAKHEEQRERERREMHVQFSRTLSRAHKCERSRHTNLSIQSICSRDQHAHPYRERILTRGCESARNMLLEPVLSIEGVAKSG